MMVIMTKLVELWMEEYVVEEEAEEEKEEEEEGKVIGGLVLTSELKRLGLRSSSVVASGWSWRFL